MLDLCLERSGAGPAHCVTVRRRLLASGVGPAMALALGAIVGASWSGAAMGEPGGAPSSAAMPAPAAQPTSPAAALTLRRVRPGEMRSGALLLAAGDGTFVEAPRLGADYDVTVSGPTARARVTQMFRNPGATHVEAVYVYPLPEGAAVDSLKMVIGDRVVVGAIKERQEAKAIYEAAKVEGRKAALVEQERPNIFTNSVANIGPGETVVVQIEYQEPVRRVGSEFSLRVPLVTGPRYNPRPLAQVVDMGRGGWGQAIVDPVPDRARIEPAYLDPREAAPTNPVTIRIRLAAGFPLGEVKSRHHTVTSEAAGEDARIVTLAAGAVPADRDFELTWTAADARAPAVGLFRESVAGSDYVLAFVTPPAVEVAAEKNPREVILVIDNSGSMGGTSIVQAKASLAYALKRLGRDDRFNVIRFNHTMEQLFPQAVAADPSNLARAAAWVDALQATGGTEMLPALEAALIDHAPGNSRHLRQVVFLTDGAIGNEQQLLDAIAARIGRSRVFTVGIGSAPNSFLMTRAAELGRGTFTHIGAVGEVEERMKSLFERLESPAVTGIAASFGDNAADQAPAILPDLYRGEPLVLAARLARPGGTLEIKGMIGEQPWVVTLPLSGAAEGKGISKVWARRRIADAEVAKLLRKLTPADADKAILALALEHHLVSRLTSLVAVDQVIAREPGQPLKRADIPLNLPAGWDFEKVFGPRAGERVPREIRADGSGPLQPTRIEGALQPTAAPTRVAAAAPPAQLHAGGGTAQGPGHHVPLPATATDAELRLIAGLALLLSGLVLSAMGRRRRIAR
jgi:Ca-activated chloride channel family protein